MKALACTQPQELTATAGYGDDSGSNLLQLGDGGSEAEVTRRWQEVAHRWVEVTETATVGARRRLRHDSGNDGLASGGSFTRSGRPGTDTKQSRQVFLLRVVVVFDESIPVDSE